VSAYLGIDAGGSSTKWALADENGVLIVGGRVAPLSGHLYSAEARTTARITLETLLEALPGGVPISAVYAGVTGLSANTEAARWLEARCADVFGARATVVDDMDLAYRAHYAPGAGVIVYAGTGSIAYHLTAQGGVRRAGGRGYLIDDAGGGFWIGARGLQAVMREFDAGRTPDNPLALLILEHIGSAHWDDIRAHVYGGGRSAVAAIAPLVGRAADHGDPQAKAILESAGAELAALAGRLLEQTGALPVTLLGGALLVSPRIAHAVRGAGVEHVLSTRDLALEAARLALQQFAADPL
jgi:N-acetylglucosamine kinase-like BadF-type ATPase